MKKLFTLMAAVLLTFIGSMNANAQLPSADVDITDNYRYGYCWNGSESISVGADGVITFNAQPWGGMAAWFGGQDWSIYASLTFEFAEPTAAGGGINVMSDGGWYGYGAGVLYATADFTGQNVTNITQVALQCGSEATLKIKRVFLTLAEKPDPDPQKYVINLVPNGDCERDYADGEVPSLTGKNGSGENAGAFFNTFEEGKGVNGSRAMVIHSTDNTAVDSWNTQFFVTSPNHIWKAGEKYKFKMTAKADYSFNAGTQIHAMPGAYIHWAGVGNFDINSEWKSFEVEGTITQDQECGQGETTSKKPQTIAFNLDADKSAAPINTFYFDNIEWWGDGAWSGSADFKDGKPVQVMDQTIAANLQEGDLIKVWINDEKGTYPVMGLTDASGDEVYAGATYVNKKYAKFGVTKKMLPILQATGINVLATDVTMKKATISENKSTVSLKDACWIGDYTFDDEFGPFIRVPAYEFTSDVEAGYTIDMRFDGNVAVNALTFTFGPSIKAGQKTNAINVDYAKNPERFKVVGNSIKLKITEEELPLLQATGLAINGDIPDVALRAIAVTPTLGTNSFNFQNMKIATSNNGNDGDIIPENLDGDVALVINDEVDGNGGAGSGAKLTITPNLDVDDYPAEVPAVSRFYMTEGGPQLRLSGGYNGMTIKIESANAFNKLAFYQTNFSISTKADKGVLDPKTGVWSAGDGVTVNDVTFTLQADTTEVWDKGKLQEVILNDMGLWWIYQIEVDPITDVVIDAADGEDLAGLISTEMAKYSKPTSLTVNLVAGGSYTLDSSVKTPVPFTLNGNGATINASAVTGNALFKMDAPNVEPNTKNFYELDYFTVKDVTVKGVNSYIYDDMSNPVVFNTFTFENCLFELTNSNSDIDCPFRFRGGGPVQFVLKNSTLYQTGSKNYKYIVKINSGNFPDKAIPDFAGPYVWQIENNTFYKCLTDKKEFMNGGRVSNNYKKTSITLKNNIFYNCSKGDGFLKNLFGGKSSDNDQKDFVSIATGNNTYFADGASAEAHGNKYDKGTILTTDPGFANAAKGDFTLSTASDQFKQKTGDPRWLSGKGAGEATGIEAVKDAQEDGVWYTIQGVRVAQPTKGLYIHNGKKVVIK